MTMSDEDRLRDFHARYHCEDGNLLGDDECGWDRCPFWEVASVVVPLARADERTKCVAEVDALLRRQMNAEFTYWYLLALQDASELLVAPLVAGTPPEDEADK